MSLHDRIKAAILARQERAQEARPGPWMTGELYGITGVWRGERPRESGIIFGSHHRSPRTHAGTDDDRAFIAAENPAFVLRQCARDLKVLERHAGCGGEDGGCSVHQYGTGCCRCNAGHACGDQRDLATAYAIEEDTDHDG